MRTVYQRLDDEGNVIHEEIEEREDCPNQPTYYGSVMRRSMAHRVIVDGRIVKDNRGLR